MAMRMCDCVVFNFLLFLSVMLVLLHFMRNKLNIGFLLAVYNLYFFVYFVFCIFLYRAAILAK